MLKRIIFVSVVAFTLTGCLSHDLVKDYEDKAYDSIAAAASRYCSPQATEGMVAYIAEHEALEFRRKIRQRGENGPTGPVVDVHLLDEKTSNGAGPVMRIYCSDDVVPDEVWKDFVRVRD